MDNMEIVTRNNQAKQEQVHNDLELFEEDLKCVLEVSTQEREAEKQ